MGEPGHDPIDRGIGAVFREFYKKNSVECTAEDEELWKDGENWYLVHQPPPNQPPLWTKGYSAEQVPFLLDMSYPYRSESRYGKDQKDYMHQSLLKAIVEAKSDDLAACWILMEPRAKLVLIRNYFHQNSRTGI